MKAQPPVWVAVVLLGGLASTVRAEPVQGSDAAPCPCHQAKASSVERTTGRYSAPAVKLLDQQGNGVELRALLSGTRPVALNFIFTSCRTICPVLSASLASLHREVGSEVDFISISIDPEFDRPHVLKDYARRFDVGPGWTLLTGSAEAVTAVRKAFGAVSAAKDAHKPLTFLRPAGSAEWVRLEGFPSTGDLVANLGLKGPKATQASR
jgi:protein SCO1/2